MLQWTLESKYLFKYLVSCKPLCPIPPPLPPYPALVLVWDTHHLLSFCFHIVSAVHVLFSPTSYELLKERCFLAVLSTDTALGSVTVPSTKQVLKNVNWMKQYTWPGVEYLVWKIKVLCINLNKNNVLSTMLLHISLKTVFSVLFHGKVRPKSPLEGPMVIPGAKKRLSPDQARRTLWAKDRLKTETEMRCWPYDNQPAVISFCKCEMTKISLKLTF